ncbi:MAG: FtsB family cell division protein [Bacillota bacterium]
MAKKSKFEIKKTVKRIITILVLGAILLFIFNIFFNLYQGHLEIKKLEAKREQLKNNIAKLDKETKQLEEKAEYINSNESIETIARQNLGLVKEDELLYVIVED